MSALESPGARGDTIINFSQVGNTVLVNSQPNAAHTQTTLSGVNIPIAISQLASPTLIVPPSIPSYLNFTLTSNHAASTVNVGPTTYYTHRHQARARARRRAA